jgi:uncharacterized Zn finger protein (UPF0148 family)
MSATEDDIMVSDLESPNNSLPSYVEVDPTDEDVCNMISELVEIEEEAKSAVDRDVNMNRSALKQEFEQAVEQEINNNRRALRATVYHNLSQQDEHWDDYIDPDVAKNKIDELINKTKDIWIQRHLDQFLNAVDEHSDSSVSGREVIKYGLAIDIVRRVISDIASDTIKNAEIVQWFVEQTSFDPMVIQEAIIALLRALIGA